MIMHNSFINTQIGAGDPELGFEFTLYEVVCAY